MKSLGYFEDAEERERIRDLLASRGIPTYWTRTYRSVRGMLFVCINEQFDDAMAVLKNPDHEVAQPVDVAEFERRTKSDGLGTILHGTVATLGFLLCIIGVLLAIHFLG
jgi:hypothetical protein